MMVRIIIKQAGDLRKPPRTVLELLQGLEKQAPIFVQLVREQLE